MDGLPPGFGHWTVGSICIWIAAYLLKMFSAQKNAAKELSELKSEFEKFLQPQIRFYVGNVLQRRVKMKDTEKVVITIELDDAKGFPTGGAFDQPPVWASDDAGQFVALTPAADGMSCVAAGVAPGNANVSVSGTVNGASYTGSLALPIVAGDAATIKLVAGAPTPQ